jgi:hypothetical protein
LFIDEIHRLSPIVEDLYSAMEDFKIDIMIESGPNARTVQLNLNHHLIRSGLYSSYELVLFLLDYNIYRGTIDYNC